jgi:hypothetical protein
MQGGSTFVGYHVQCYRKVLMARVFVGLARRTHLMYFVVYLTAPLTLPAPVSVPNPSCPTNSEPLSPPITNSATTYPMYHHEHKTSSTYAGEFNLRYDDSTWRASSHVEVGTTNPSGPYLTPSIHPMINMFISWNTSTNYFPRS